MPGYGRRTGLSDVTPVNPETAKAAVAVLHFFAKAAEVRFDRSLALRTLAEISRAIPTGDQRGWAQRMVAAGESLDLRMRHTEMSVDDAFRLAHDGVPTAVCYPRPDVEGDSVDWYMIGPARGRKVWVQRPGEDKGVWESPRQLKKRLSQGPDAPAVRWLIGQAALPCAIRHSKQTDDGRPPRPFERLMALIRADSSDLWAILVFSMVVGILALATPIAVEALVNTVAFGRYLQPIVILSLILLTFLGFAAAIRAFNAFIAEMVQRRLFVRVVEDLAYRLPRVNQSALDGQYGPELVNRFFDIVTVQKVAASLLLDGISIVLQTSIGMAVLAFYHPFLLGFDLLLLICILVITVGLGRYAVRTAIVESKQKYRVAAWLQDLVRNPTAFKLHGGAFLGLDRADKLAVDYLEARRDHFRILMRQILFALSLQAIAATSLLGLGGWLVIQNELTLGQLVAAELIVMNIVGSFAKIGKHLEGIYDLLASVDKLGQLFDLPIERHDKLFHLEEGRSAELEFHAVQYAMHGRTLLDRLSVTFPNHSRVAVVGPPGAGKSSLLDLIVGLRAPQAGYLSLDGIDLRELRPDSLREHVSMSRNVEIFAGTIEENVHLNRPHINASDVRQALDSVELLEEIMRLPQGLNTPLQTGGYPLSQSQALRLMIARAIVNRPRLLLVDGTLDSLEDGLAERVLDHLVDQTWSLFIATGRRSIASRLPTVLDLSRNELRSQEVSS